MPNTSGKEFDRRYNNRRKSSDEDYYNFNPMYRNSSREKKATSSSQSSDMKQPLRSYGDWSEFLSSNGKIYFYNRKTERAQWEKPDEWDWLIMQEEKSSKNYYQQSGKDTRNINRFRSKYDNGDMFEPGMKPRYNSYDNHKYHRDYSNDYMGSNPSTFRPSYGMNDRYSNQNMSMQGFQNSMPINDYYDANQSYPQGGSSSNSEYYQSPPMFRNNNYQNKDWNQMSKMQYIQNSSNGLNSPSNIKNSPRYQVNQYDETNMNKPYMYQQRNHLSRYDSYNENNMNQKYSYNQANASCNNNTYQNTEYNNFNSFNNTNNNNQSSNFSKSCNNLNNKNQDIKQVQSVVQPQVQNTNQVSRSRTNSESASMSPVNKKFKKSEDVEKSKAVDDESWDENMEDKAINETVEEKKIEETEVKLEENNPKEKQEAPEQVIKEETKENQTEQKPGPQEPVLTSTVEDINKYYRAELVTRLTSCLGVVENLNWINQPYQKHCQYSRLCVDIKNLRSIVRVKEIKKTQQEQRLLFLQSQMKEIEEMLS